ncbi:T9SS type A sorting domain-containing protein [Pseudoflavitalea rhizosphaerae]|uniref:T9SS type A sorting domain-containing protein n=1 Tax=Pseudoflavitalea rhizosphaerae TaxID=1884793 RepID=UPI000F8F0BD0|nr:T9SS type A sorting domain-containing protein [Pseudoflavitalea rhizosphaerae]
MTQTICGGGFTQALTGNKVALPSSDMPTLIRGGVTIPQTEISARYQWQTATAAAGPWTNISGAAGTLKDYSPPSLAETRYYRRIVLPAAGCGETPVSTSAVAEVVVGANNSPVITSSAYTTCVGSPVNIEATVSGGATPYTYSWDNGIGSITNTATVTPTTHSVYTLTVTDNNGCEQKGQVVVNAYAANAGPDAIVCAGKPVRLGVAPPAGVAGMVYAWTPATDLSDVTIAQPLASPTTAQTYSLEMTVPITGGGTCTTTDDVNVSIVAGPVTANFAGNDVAVCKGSTAVLGNAAEAGFSYTWSPGNYLNATNASTATYDPGSGDATPNPITYTLTAASGGCSFTDDVTVYQLNVDAGDSRICGPRTVGAGDPMPAVTGKTFLWEVVSGTGTITGATNTATTTVSESLGGPTVYRVTMSYLGTSCFDLVTVPVCGDAAACALDSIEVIADHSCPSTAFGAVTLRAAPSNLNTNDWTYTWSSAPAGGISSTTGPIITLTDNVERDVTVTVASKNNPNSRCSKTIRVNGASWALPTFTAQDHVICEATPVNIGQAAVAGYSYSWTSVDPSDRYASNPTVSPAVTTNYLVVVKEPTSGCSMRDTATVKVAAVVADPGADWITCSNAVIQLGSPARPNYTYSWTPAVASYQDGTTNTSAQPKVLVAITQDFTLRATDTESGCFKDSTVHIVVDDNPVLTTLRDTAICRGTSAVIGNPMNGNVTFAWSPAAGLSSTTVAQPVANPTATQTYTLVVTYYDAANVPVCTKSGTVTVTVGGPEITMTDASVCTSDALYNLGNNASVTGTIDTYTWSPELSVSNPAIINPAVLANPTTSAQYTLVVRDVDGCYDTATTILTATTTPPNAGSATVVCAGSSVMLGDPGNVGTCTWTVTPTPDAGSFPVTTGPSPVFTPSVADAGASALVGRVFTFTCSQDIGGCINTSTVNVTVRAFSLPAMPVQTVCENASANIGVTPAAGVSYSWSPATNLADPFAATTQVSNVTGTSSYTLTAVHENGCVATADAVVGVNPTPAPTVSIADVTTKFGTPAPSFNPQVNPAAGSYTYNWTPANKVNDPYINNAMPTENRLGTYTYSLSVTDGNGCTSTAQALLRIENLDILPVTLSSFTATSKDCGVTLNWKVESASNFSHFIVERSLNGGSYVAVKKVNYEFNRIYYNYQDAETGNGNWSYRLKMVDIDGRYEYSSIVRATVKCTSANSSLKIYPNPASSILYINSSKPVKSVVVYTLTGSQVLRKDYAQSAAGVLSLPVSNLVTGIYLVQVIAQDGTSQPARLVKD